MSAGDFFNHAVEQYGEYGIDVEKALLTVDEIPISMNCWQGDDVGGFESDGATLDGGGIQVTGCYPGKPRSITELRGDIEKAFSLIPGTKRLNLHANYADFTTEKKVERNELESKHFASWLEWAKSQNVNLDFNATLFSHPKAENFTLSSPDKSIRDFWIEHVDACRKISAYFGKEQGDSCIHNIWIPDGMKDIPVERGMFRENLMDSLDKIFAKSNLDTKYVKDAVESKVFGIGSESYVVGSHEFYMGYAMSRNKLLTLDMGHFHPTELVADKISSALLFVDELLLHVSRNVRWDSDHVVIQNDDLAYMAREIIHSDKIEKIHIGLDFFDGSINRIGAWTVGTRAARKALLSALLEPREALAKYELEGNYFARLALYESTKTLPFGAVWAEYCNRAGVPQDSKIISAVMDYEKSILSKRV